MEVNAQLVVKPLTAVSSSVLKLSEMDNSMVRVYSQLGYFFFNKEQKEDFMSSEALCRGLAETLDDFRELAGRLVEKENGSLEVECCDQGVEWIEQQSQEKELMASLFASGVPQGEVPLNLLAPPQGNNGPIMKVQLTRFPDHSLILCVAVHHSITDGSGLFRFMKCWSDRCRGHHNLQPLTDRALLLGDGKEPTHTPNEFMIYKLTEEDIKNMMAAMALAKPKPAHIFRLTKESASELKAAVAEEQKQGACIARVTSTNDALCALIWRAAIKARGVAEDQKSTIGMACNGRARFNPPLPETYFGNVNYYVTATLGVEELCGENGLGKAGAMVRQGVDSMTDERMRSTVNWIAKQPDRSAILPSFNITGNDFAVTNWSTFPVYDADFGGGLPFAVRLPVREMDGLAVLFPGPPSDPTTLEIAVGLAEEAMAKFREDPFVKKYLTLKG